MLGFAFLLHAIASVVAYLVLLGCHSTDERKEQRGCLEKLAHFSRMGAVLVSVDNSTKSNGYEYLSIMMIKTRRLSILSITEHYIHLCPLSRNITPTSTSQSACQVRRQSDIAILVSTLDYNRDF